MENGRLVTLSQHELALVGRISQVLRLDGTHILSLEECMMAYGKVYDTLLGGKKESWKSVDLLHLPHDLTRERVKFPH